MDDVERVSEALEEGYSRSEVREILRQEGYSENKISNIISSATTDQKSSSSDGDHSSRSNLRIFQKYSIFSVLLVTSVMYSGYETGLLDGVILGGLGKVSNLALTGILTLNLLTGIYQFTKNKNWLLPTFSSITLLSIVFADFLYSPSMSKGLEFNGGSALVLSIIILANGFYFLTAIFSSAFIYNKNRLGSFIILLIPILVIGGSYGYTNWHVQNQVQEVSNQNIQHPTLTENHFDENNFTAAASQTPPANRLALKIAAANQAYNSLKTTRPITYTKRKINSPSNICSKQSIEDSVKPEKTSKADTLGDGAVDLSMSITESLKGNKEFIQESLRNRCTESSSCKVNQKSFPDITQNYISQQNERTEALQSILKKSSDVNAANIDPKCSNNRRFKLRLKNVQCGKSTRITLENKAEVIEDSEITASLNGGDIIYQSKKINELSGEKTFNFEPLYQVEEDNPMFNKNMTLTLTIPEKDIRITAYCSPDEGFCENCEEKLFPESS